MEEIKMTGEDFINGVTGTEARAGAKVGEGMTRVAAYIRVSTETEAQAGSFERQKQYFEELLNSNREWISVGIYYDYGISGTSEKKRAGFKRLLRHCREGKIDRIVCKSISRFARNTVDFMKAIDLLRENHVTAFFEKENLDTADKVNTFILTTLSAIAQEESRNISENVRWGKGTRYRKGEAANYALYGYRFCEGMKTDTVTGEGGRYRRIEIVEEEAVIVRRIYQEFVAGKRMVDIAAGLNCDKVSIPLIGTNAKRRFQRQMEYVDRAARKQGITSKGIGERGWTSAMIGNILRMERYTGDVLLQKFYVADYMDHRVKRNKGELPYFLSRRHHPGIITQEIFQEAQKILSGHPNYGRSILRRERQFSGVLVCACCGRYYHVHCKAGQEIWFCPSTKRHNGMIICSNENLSGERAELVFRKAVSERFRLRKVPGQEDNSGDIRQMIIRLETFQRLDCVETEKTFEQREEALEWMRRISGGPGRAVQLLDGLTCKHVKALIRSIMVCSSSRFLIHWFDDIITEITL